MKFQYKNESGKLVNIRGLKLKPGETITSRVFIKHFEEEVKKGNLAVYVDGERISLEEAQTVMPEVNSGNPPAPPVIPPENNPGNSGEGTGTGSDPDPDKKGVIEPHAPETADVPAEGDETIPNAKIEETLSSDEDEGGEESAEPGKDTDTGIEVDPAASDEAGDNSAEGPDTAGDTEKTE